MFVPKAMMCMKKGWPSNTVIGLNYFNHEDEFPKIMKEIITKLYPFTATNYKDHETSNDLLVKWILKEELEWADIN